MNLRKKLVVGARIRIGKQYSKNNGMTAGEVVTLVEGTFEYDNGLYTEVQTSPAIFNEYERDFESIFHLFGNDLEDFEDCEILSS